MSAQRRLSRSLRSTGAAQTESEQEATIDDESSSSTGLDLNLFIGFNILFFTNVPTVPSPASGRISERVLRGELRMGAPSWPLLVDALPAADGLDRTLR